MNAMRATGLEPTYRAVHAFLSALPASRYDVRAIPAEGSSASPELWQPGAHGLLRLIPSLRARKAHAFHIYVRPADTAYILVDDPDADGLDALRAATMKADAQTYVSRTIAAAERDLAQEDADHGGGDPER